MTTVSVVVPVYAGEAYLADLAAAVGDVRAAWAVAHPEVELVELLLVNDDPVDGSAAITRELAASHGWIESIELSHNFGQHPATIAGILHSSGDWVVTLDEDLQHPPSAIARLLRRAVSDHADVVYGAAEGAVHGSWRRDLTSSTYKRLLSWLARNPDIRDFSSFRCCRGEIARAGASVAGHETYLDVALSWFTGRVTVERMPLVDQRFQESNTSSYDLWKLFSHARRLVVSSHTRIMRIAAGVGVFAVLIATLFGARALWAQSSGSSVYVAGWPSLFLSILFFGGLTAFLLVVTLEYLINVTLHTQGKPTFFVVDRSEDDAVAAALARAYDDAARG
jgi:glycosyltransferase involved in cell wall biosynthesis